MPEWTREQAQAIHTRGQKLLVSAAAGAGKTAVLVERVCHYLVELGGDLDRLLVVTFTDAAAGEMRQRIAAALRSRLAARPGDEHLRRQLALLERAHISTIHSFCLWVLRRYFYRLDLDPSFRVMDEGEDRLLKLETLEQVLEQRYREEPYGSAFYALVDRYSDQQGEQLQQLVLRLYECAQSQVFPADWLEKCATAFAIPAGASLEALPWYSFIRSHALAEVQNAHGLLQAALQLTQHPQGPAHYHRFITSDLAVVQDVEKACQQGWDAACQALSDLKFVEARGGKAPADLDQTLLERVKKLRDDAKKRLINLRKACYIQPAAAMLADLQELATPAAALIDLVKEFGAAYSQAKQSRGLVNFSDLERYTLQLLLAEEARPGCLLPSDTTRELQQSFSEVLCDEYQDINPVQDAILGLVAGEYSSEGPAADTFMVGDVKQSIYRFRLAEPRIFLQRSQQAGSTQGSMRIDLAANFRCRRTIVNGVNTLFRMLMTSNVGDVDYDAAAELIYRADYQPLPAQPEGRPADAEPPVELVLLEGDPGLLDDAQRALARSAPPAAGEDGDESSEGDDSSDQDGDELDLAALEREATLIARRIRRMVQEPEHLVWDKAAGAYRPVRYRDIVVLLRATQVKASQFIDIFQREGVPVYAEAGSGYFRAPEVEIVLSLLAVIDNPRQDLPLAGVLRSPLVGLQASELADIRLAAPEGDYYDAVTARAAQDDDLGARLRAFLAQLDSWRTQARRGPLAELVWRIYRDTCYYDYVGGMPGGGQRQANLRALYDRALQFDQFARRGLIRFLQFIGDLKAAGVDLGTAPALGENEDVVRLMSIHKSKGLEFPVVFVAGLGVQFNQQDLKGTLLFDRELGLGPQFVNPLDHTRRHTLASLGVRESMRRAGLSEEMRILYVALTRAREHLIMVGTVRDVATSLERWRQAAEQLTAGQQLPVYQTATARRFLDWIGPVMASMPGLVPAIPVDCRESTVHTGALPGWRVTVYPPGAVVKELSAAAGELGAGEAAAAAATEALDLPPALVTQLQRQLDWQYPGAALSGIAAKATVTELKRREILALDPENPGAYSQRPVVLRRPSFLQAAGRLSAAEVGTATHLVLQHLPLDRPVTAETLAQCVADLVKRNFLTSDEGAAVDQGALLRFWQGPLGQRLQAAGSPRVLREVPFSLAVPWPEVPGLTPAGSPLAAHGKDGAVVLQGVVDCMFDTGAGWALLDFKTDKVRAAAADVPAVAAERYATQLRWYAKAMQQILRVTVTECYLVLLAHDLVVPMPVSHD